MYIKQHAIITSFSVGCHLYDLGSCRLFLQLTSNQWRSQSAANARTQHGHTTFEHRSQGPPSFQPLAVQKYRSNWGGLGEAPPENFVFLSFLGRF